MPTADFGTRLLLVRTNLGLTIEEIADLTGQKTPTWSTWERGSTPRNMGIVVDQIARALGVDRDWLMWGGPLGSGPPGGLRLPHLDSNQEPADSRFAQVRWLRKITLPVHAQPPRPKVA